MKKQIHQVIVGNGSRFVYGKCNEKTDGSVSIFIFIFFCVCEAEQSNIDKDFSERERERERGVCLKQEGN